MIEFLLDPFGRTALALNLILQLVFLIPQRGELFLEFRTITKQVNELVVVLWSFRFAFEYCRDTCHGRSLYIIQTHRDIARCAIERNNGSRSVLKH